MQIKSHSILKVVTNILKHFCLAASIALLAITIPIFINSSKHLNTINEYLSKAKVKEVNIIDCQKQNDFLLFGNNYEVKVSYFTKPIFKGGEFKLHPILKFVNKKAFKEIIGKKKTNILYFDDKPEQTAILEVSTDIRNFSITDRQDIALLSLTTSIILFSIFRIFVLSNRKSS